MHVDVQGLQAWSAQCGAIARELAVGPAAASAPPSGQSTTTAVSAGQSLVAGTASLMATRVQGTGALAAAAAAAYAANDDESAQRLAAVSPGPLVG